MSWQKTHIDELRARGHDRRTFRGRPVLLLTTTGAKTGRPHTTPMMYLPQDGRLFVFASKGGTPTNPDWYRNLVANPTGEVELGAERFEATARPLSGDERGRVYARQTELYPQFGEYERKTERTIPVVELVRSHTG